jgi:ribosomal protein L7/L12
MHAFFLGEFAMPENARDHQIIMEKVPPDRQPEAALYLSGCFSLPPASTKGIAASGPIALLSDLERRQAEAILKELVPPAPAGVALRVAGPGDKARVSRLQWPRPPRVYGSTLDEFVKMDVEEIACPHCGGLIRVTREADGLQAVASGPDKRRSGETDIQRPPSSSDQDPLFSGIKPLDPDTSKYASIRSLQAGDTGFWMDHGRNAFSPSPPPDESAASSHGGAANAKKSTGKIQAGLAAFMKPGAYALVVGRTRDSQAVKMIADIMGLGENEARERALNLGLCVARDISLDEAQNLLIRFRNLGAKARIVRPSLERTRIQS